jgi:arylsulfatase A-like enzyme
MRSSLRTVSRRDFLGTAAAGAFALRPAGATRKPNFLVIVADDMGFSDAGCYGGDIATPNLDRLAAGGIRFTQFYSAGRCWPSRTAILTGYYPQQVNMDPPRGKLPSWARVLPHYLKPAGYRCYHAGKWHLTTAPHPVGDGGFHRSYCIEDHDRFFSPKEATLDDRDLPPVPDGSGFYLTSTIADYGIQFLREHQSQHAADPFLLYLCFTSPHFPLHAMQKDIDKYRETFLDGWDAARQRHWERMRRMKLVNCSLSRMEPDVVPDWNLPEAALHERIGPGEAGHAVAWDSLTAAQKRFQATKMAIHAAMVDRMDQEIGRVLDQLRGMEAFENTVVFFVSDNGASAEQLIRGDGNDMTAAPGSAKTFLCLGPGWSTASNSPFRLHKSWVHEGGISSPLIVHWPAGLKARGELRHNPGHFMDLLPTILDLAGLQPGPTPGRSLAPAFGKDGAVAHEYIYFHHLENKALRCGDWKLVSKGGQKGPAGPWELYDLSRDRCEEVDLAAKYPERVRTMAELWEKTERAFREQAGAPM